MSSAAFYRRQAEDYLRRAERAEALEGLRELRAGDVVTFERERVVGWPHATMSYAAIAVQVENSGNEVGTAGLYWYLTGSRATRTDRMTTDELIAWFIAQNIEDVNVVSTVYPLGEPPASDEQMVDVAPDLSRALDHARADWSALRGRLQEALGINEKTGPFPILSVPEMVEQLIRSQAVE